MGILVTIVLYKQVKRESLTAEAIQRLVERMLTTLSPNIYDQRTNTHRRGDGLRDPVKSERGAEEVIGRRNVAPRVPLPSRMV